MDLFYHHNISQQNKMTVKELREHLTTLTQGSSGFDNYEIVIREYATTKSLPLELHTSLSPQGKTFELVTKKKIK